MVKKSMLTLVSVAFLGAIIGKGLRYAIQFIIARGLGAEALGFFAVGLVVVKLGARFAQAGLDNAAQKYVSIHNSNGNDRKLSGAVLTTFLFSILFGAMTVLAINIVLEMSGGLFAEYHTVIRLFSVAIPLYALMEIGMYATQGFKETKYGVYVREFGQSGLALVLIAVSSYVFASLELVVYSYIVSLAAGVALVVYYIYQLGGFASVGNSTFQSREILAYSLPLLFAGATMYAAAWVDIMFLSALTTPDQVGIYQIAYQTSILMMIGITSVNVIFPSFVAEAYSNGDRAYLDQLYTSITKWTTYLTIFISLLVIVFARDIMAVFGAEFVAGTEALMVLAVGQALVAITGPGGVMLKMTEFERMELYNSIGMLVINGILNFVLIQRYGILGAAIATAFSLSLLNVARLLEARYFVGLFPYSVEYWKGFTALLAPLLIFVFFAEVLGGIAVLFVSGLCGGVAFLATMYAFGLEESDRTLIEAIDADQ